MEYLKIKSLNGSPNNGWRDILNLIENVTPWVSITALIWKAINEYVKWIKSIREDQMKEIVKNQIHDQVNPQISKLSESIDELKESIWALKSKI